MGTRQYEHPANGQVGDFTDAAARRFGLVPVDEPAVAEVVAEVALVDDDNENDQEVGD